MKKRSAGGLGPVLGWAWGALTANLGLKLICFLLAFLLVAYQRSLEEQKTRTVAFKLDVQLPGEASQRELMTTLPPEIRVTLEGSTRALDALDQTRPSIALDLRDGRQDRLILTEDLVEIPPGVTVKFMEPDSVELAWENLATRSVPVQSSVTGTVATGYEVAHVALTQESVDLRGPRSLVNVTQFVRVAPFDVTGLSEGSFKRLLALDPPPSRTSYVASPNVTVEVTIQRRLVSASFSRIPVEVVGLPGARTTPPAVDVTVIGAPEVVRALERELVVPRVDLSKVEPTKHGSTVLQVSVDLTNAKTEIQPPTVNATW